MRVDSYTPMEMAKRCNAYMRVVPPAQCIAASREAERQESAQTQDLLQPLSLKPSTSK